MTFALIFKLTVFRPWFKIEKDGKEQTFFGNDRWEHIASFLGVQWQGLEVCQGTPSARL